jgi:hypothetical protein
VTCDGSARKGRRGARNQRKRGEPQGRKRGATSAPREGGGSRRGGGRPRGRNADGKWHSRPEGGRRPGDRRSDSGSGLPGDRDDGGAIFGQSQERKLGRPGRSGASWATMECTGGTPTGVRAAGPGCVGIDGVKVKRVERTLPIGCVRPRDDGVLEGSDERDRARSKATEEGGEGRPTAPSFRASPRSSDGSSRASEGMSGSAACRGFGHRTRVDGRRPVPGRHFGEWRDDSQERRRCSARVSPRKGGSLRIEPTGAGVPLKTREPHTRPARRHGGAIHRAARASPGPRANL